MSDNNTKKAAKTYRFKFTDDFIKHLMEFSRIHRFDDASAFKDNWKTWCDENKMLINQESNVLKAKGYEGDALIKMYKSARYYFKNKSAEKKDAKKRRQYVGLNPEFRESIDNHIETVSLRQELKPADGYINFMDSVKYTTIIQQEKLKLESYNFTKEEITSKLKKTYKNRYFNMKKNS
jgi:hypothetical protein